MNNLIIKLRRFFVLLAAFLFALSLSSGFITFLADKKAQAFHSANSCLTSGTPGASNDLIIQTGESLTLSGEWFCDEITINGTLMVTPHNGSDPASGNIGTGRIVLHSNSTTVGAAGVIDASGAGFAGGTGGSGGAGGNGGVGGVGDITNPTRGTDAADGAAGISGSSGFGAGGGGGGANGGASNSEFSGNGGQGNLIGGEGGGGGGLNTTGNSGANGTYGSSADPTTNETLLMGAGGGGGTGGAGGQGGGGGGGGGAIGADGGLGGNGGNGGGGGVGGRGGGIVKLYSSGSLIIGGNILTKGLIGTSGSTGSGGTIGANGSGLGAGVGGSAGNADTVGFGGGSSLLSTGGGGGGGGAGGATGKSGGAGAGGGILLRSEASNGVNVTGTLDARGGTNPAQNDSKNGTIKAFYACTTPTLGTFNGRVYTQILDPAFSAINPTSGPTAGGQSVTISGARMCADPTVNLGGALDPAAAPTAVNTGPGSVLSNAVWAIGNAVKYVYTARVGANETTGSPIGSLTAQPTVLDPTSAATVANASEGVKEQGTAYAVGDSLQYQYAAENHLGRTNVSPSASHTVLNAVSNLNAVNGGQGITNALNTWATSATYNFWATVRVYPTQTDFNNDTNGTETFADVTTTTTATTGVVQANDLKFDVTLPNFACATPGSNGCLWNQGRLRFWSRNGSAVFGGAEYMNQASLGNGAVPPHCDDSTGAGFKMGDQCGDASNVWPSSFSGQTITVHLNGNLDLTPSPARPTANDTGARQVNITVPAPPAGLSSSPTTKNGLLYRKIGADSFALLDTHASYSAGYTVNDIGNAASGAPPGANTTGVQTASVSWSPVSGATDYNIYRCIGTCASITDDFDLIASFSSATTSMIDSGLAADSNDGPASTNQTLCQSPSVNADGTATTCTTAAHPAGLVSLTLINHQPSPSVNSFTEPNAYIYSEDSGSDTEPPTQPGTPQTASPANDNTPTWDWTASTDNVAISHYVFCWDTNSGGCANTSNTSDNNFTHSTALADGTWYVKVKAVDTSNNESAFSPVGSTTINTSSSDTTPPSVPGKPQTATPTSDNTPTWDWTASTDDVGISHYVFCWDTISGGCSNSGTSPGNSFNHSAALTDGTWYAKVKAVDTSGNESDYSAVGQTLIDTSTGGSGGGAIEEANESETSTRASIPKPNLGGTRAGPLEDFPVTEDGNRSDKADMVGRAEPPGVPRFDWQIGRRWLLGLALFGFALTLWILWRRLYAPRLVLLGGQDGLRVVMLNLKAKFVKNIRFQIRPPRKLMRQWGSAFDKDLLKDRWHKIAAMALVPRPKRQKTNPPLATAIITRQRQEASKLPAEDWVQHGLDLPDSARVNLIKHDQGFAYALGNENAQKPPEVVMDLKIKELGQTSDGDISFKVEVGVLHPKRHAEAAIKWRAVDHRSWIRRLLGFKPKPNETGWTIFGEIKS